MEVKICDLCLKDSGTIKLTGGRGWHSWGWSNSGIRRIHYCSKHSTNAMKGTTLEQFRKLVYEIDSKYGHYQG
jgi:hypothetical protein